MKSLPALPLVSVLLLFSISPVVAATIHPDVELQLQQGLPEYRVIVKLRDNLRDEDLGRIALQAAEEAPRQKRRRVVESLKAKADRTQGGVREHILRLEQQGKARQVQSFWIFNGMALAASPEAVRELAKRDDVDEILPDRIRKAAAPVASVAAAPAGWNIDRINVRTLWSRGYTGQGVIVATFDTGVNSDHIDNSGTLYLKPSWRGGSNSWFDPYRSTTVPYDPNGHGTATMSVIVGGAAGGVAIGVAPGAKWISAKIFDDNGFSTDSAIHAAFQWALNPDRSSLTADAPDIVSNSWVFTPDSANPLPIYDEVFRPDIQKLKAAGIAVVFAAGNEGPAASTSASPANYPESVAVGATTVDGAVATFSSRGPTAAPVTAFTSAGLPVDLKYPQLCAPGASISVADRIRDFTTESGTSFAAPHVAGAMAVLKSAIPGLGIRQMETALKQSVVGSGGPDNDCGYGVIDVGKALSYLSVPGDVDGDGKVKVNDLVMVMKAVVNPALADGLVLHNGDVYPVGAPDGRITLQDALLILRKTVGLPSF
jgi:serine protease AprX